MNHVMPATEPTTSENPQCAVCPHPWAAHDRVAARFCTATISERHSRGCACGS